MDTTDGKYKNLINKLQTVHPKLSNPEELTENIMKSIQIKKQFEPVRILIKARPWISVAAVFLVGLYLFQQTEVNLPDTNSKPILMNKNISLEDNCLTNYFLNKNNEESFFESYLCYLRQSELKNEKSNQLIQKFQN